MRAWPNDKTVSFINRTAMPKFAANLSWLFTEVPFIDRLGLARQHGFAGVECLFPYEVDKADLHAALADHQLTLALHNLPAGDWQAGERGIAILPDRKEEFRDGVQQALDYATALNCRQLNCLVGLAPADADPALLRATLVENLSYAAEVLARAHIRLLVEPINTRDMPDFYLNRTDDAVNLIAEVGAQNLYVQYDIYHMQIMEGDIARTLSRHLPKISHIQLADNPGRNEPGTGELNYPFLFKHLDDLGYTGWIGCEYKPRTSSADSLGWLTAIQNNAVTLEGLKT
jgi:hydroxypyruvate isomerase